VRGARRGIEVRKLGIIGGMTWSSTALYYEHINREISRRLGGLHSGRIAIESLEFADIAAKEFAGDWDGIGHDLLKAAQNLEADVVIAADAAGFYKTRQVANTLVITAAPGNTQEGDLRLYIDKDGRVSFKFRATDLDELAPSDHSITSFARTSSVGGTSNLLPAGFARRPASGPRIPDRRR